MTYSGYEAGDVSLDVDWEFLHGDEELGTVGYLDGAVYLKV